jgi:hypothetical protein
LRLIAIVEVLPGAENFYIRKSGGLNAVEPHGRQPVIHEQVSRKRLLHGGRQ